jgi:hypothetical protein
MPGNGLVDRQSSARQIAVKDGFYTFSAWLPLRMVESSKLMPVKVRR